MDGACVGAIGRQSTDTAPECLYGTCWFEGGAGGSTVGFVGVAALVNATFPSGLQAWDGLDVELPALLGGKEMFSESVSVFSWGGWMTLNWD